jgi:hypothetical protein
VRLGGRLFRHYIREFAKYRYGVNLPQVVVNYTIPLKTQKVEPLEREVLPFAYAGSPSKLKDRTFQVVFQLSPAGKIPRAKAPRPAILHRNPIIIAREWQEARENGGYPSLAAWARRLGVTRARVTQVLQLLNLVPEVVSTIAALGNPLPAPIITERRLRAYSQDPC